MRRMLPFAASLWVAMIVGIWSLTTINRFEIKEAFRLKAEMMKDEG